MGIQERERRSERIKKGLFFEMFHIQSSIYHLSFIIFLFSSRFYTLFYKEAQFFVIFYYLSDYIDKKVHKNNSFSLHKSCYLRVDFKNCTSNLINFFARYLTIFWIKKKPHTIVWTWEWNSFQLLKNSQLSPLFHD